MTAIKTDRLMHDACTNRKDETVCRKRGGESCAFDGAMIVLEPIADAAHLVHGPVACGANSWQGRGTVSSKGTLHKMCFTTDMDELDIVYGSEARLLQALREVNESARPAAIFVYLTCVSGLIGEDIDRICREAEGELNIRVIPVNAPGFAGPKNLGNRIAGDALLEHVIGTAEPPFKTPYDINLIGEFNIAGDYKMIGPLMNEIGIRVLSTMTGDAGFNEIRWAHRAKLNVMVCSRALINVAQGMKRKYGMPFMEASFFGRTETSRALRNIAEEFGDAELIQRADEVIAREEARLNIALEKYAYLRGVRAVLYTGGVKSWSFISALKDLGIDVVAVGTKKSTYEDEEKIKALLDPNAPMIDDVNASKLLQLMKDHKAELLIAGGRNLYLGVKEGIPFVDVNQEREHAYAGYGGLLNFADRIAAAMRFYGRIDKGDMEKPNIRRAKKALSVNPVKNAASIGAAMAMQGVHRALPLLHGAQGCGFLEKVLLTKHFREPISLESTRLFSEDVVMSSDEVLIERGNKLIARHKPSLIAVIGTALTEVKGDDIGSSVRELSKSGTPAIYVSAPDYAGALESGYGSAVKALAGLARNSGATDSGLVNVLCGPHLTPADFYELRCIVEDFGLRPVMLPDLSALDGSRKAVSALALGGALMDEIESMANAALTMAIGESMRPAAELLKSNFGMEYALFDGLSTLDETDMLMQKLSAMTGIAMPKRYQRQRSVLIDGMRDAQFVFAGKRICTALEADHTAAIANAMTAMAAEIEMAVMPEDSPVLSRVNARDIVIGDMREIEGMKSGIDLVMSNSHARPTANKIDSPLYEAGFPVYKTIGASFNLTIGYRGSLGLIYGICNKLMAKEAH